MKIIGQRMLKKLFQKKLIEPKEELVATPIPALVSVLLRKEQEKGSALTESEVLKIRDNAASIMLPMSANIKMAESRGYSDLNPSHAWEQWQKARTELT